MQLVVVCATIWLLHTAAWFTAPDPM